MYVSFHPSYRDHSTKEEQSQTPASSNAPVLYARSTEHRGWVGAADVKPRKDTIPLKSVSGWSDYIASSGGPPEVRICNPNAQCDGARHHAPPLQRMLTPNIKTAPIILSTSDKHDRTPLLQSQFCNDARLRFPILCFYARASRNFSKSAKSANSAPDTRTQRDVPPRESC